MNIEKMTTIRKIVGITLVIIMGIFMIIAVKHSEQNTDANTNTELLEVQRQPNNQNTQPTNTNTGNNEVTNQYNFQYVENNNSSSEDIIPDESLNEGNIVLDENGEPVNEKEYTERTVVIDGVEYTVYE